MAVRRIGRRTAREVAMKVLYQVDVGRQDPEDALATSLEGSGLPDVLAAYVRRLVRGTLAHLGAIDGDIARCLVDWDFHRLPRLEKALLRLAIFEFRHEPDVPAEVIIDEAVEIAKKYSTPDGARFVNGVLGRLVREREAGTLPPEETLAPPPPPRRRERPAQRRPARERRGPPAGRRPGPARHPEGRPGDGGEDRPPGPAARPPGRRGAHRRSLRKGPGPENRPPRPNPSP